jgi:hypothetical protein
MSSHTSDQEKFEREFGAREYLLNYYKQADLELVRKYVVQKDAAAETMRIMMFLDSTCAPLAAATFGKEKATLLELGGGPTLYQLMNIVNEVKEIHFTDFVEDNLHEVRLWKDADPNAYDWNQFLEAALMLKKDSSKVSPEEVKSLEYELRNKITRIGHCDIFQPDLGVEKENYEIISSHFVAESATSSRTEWQKALENMHRKLAPKGLLVMSALRGAKGSYKVLEKEFPAVELYEDDMQIGLQAAGFSVIRISSIHTEEKSNNYEGFMFVIAQKS